MVKLLLFSLILFTIAGCVGRKIVHKLFDGKILVYSEQTTDPKKASEFNSFFIAYKDRRMIPVEHPFGYMHAKPIEIHSLSGEGDSIIRYDNTYSPPESDAPYQFFRKGKQIFIEYFNGKNTRRRLFYVLNKKDSVNKIPDRKVLWSDDFFINLGVSYYRGRDTSIYLNTIRLKCWIFEEYYPGYKASLASKKRIFYLEKKSLLPVMEIEQYFEGSDFKIFSGYTHTTSKLNFVVDYDSTKFTIKRDRNN